MVKTLIIFLILIVFGCSKTPKQELFNLDNDLFEETYKNNDCNQLFSKKFNKEHLKDQMSLFEGMIEKLVSVSNQSYKRVILIKLQESGEVITTTRISIRVLSDNNALVTKHIKNIDLLKTTETIESFNIEHFYTRMNESLESKIGNRTNAIIFDFQKNNCICNFYEDIKYSEIENIKSLNFFE